MGLIAAVFACMPLVCECRALYSACQSCWQQPAPDKHLACSRGSRNTPPELTLCAGSLKLSLAGWDGDSAFFTKFVEINFVKATTKILSNSPRIVSVRCCVLTMLLLLPFLLAADLHLTAVRNCMPSDLCIHMRCTPYPFFGGLQGTVYSSVLADQEIAPSIKIV